MGNELAAASVWQNFLDEKRLAEYLDVSVRTVQGWRSRGGGPRYVKLGRRVRYARPDIEAWLERQSRSSVFDQGDGVSS